MKQPVFLPTEILLPGPAAAPEKWAVLACDQFTSQPEYWQQAEALVGDAPSTLHIIFPEVYLEQPGGEARIAGIHAAMQKYRHSVLTQAVNGFVYVERTTPSGTRCGLVGCVDLEDYSYEAGAAPRIRPSEGTLVERIPPRLAVRRGGALECPHILMLADDAACTVIEPIGEKKAALAPLYDFTLMLEGGRLQAWAVTDAADIAAVQAALAALEEAPAFAARYGAAAGAAFALAVGDGNHSLATAKALWEETKQNLTPQQQENHPARYCMVELCNIQSAAIGIEPIHRVVFGPSAEEFRLALEDYARQNAVGISADGDQRFTLLYEQYEEEIHLRDAREALAVGSVDAAIAWCAQSHPGLRVDYVHGEDAVRQLAAGGAVGLLLPPFEKSDLFRGVALGGVLPRKTFSMGHATEKRYYMECRAIL
ncbi:DUF1015 domain-containing protein [Ruminococcaceae bacterium OttesenSCG-928-O06]|nr:DUF1015 domain-containing protein [Ruminococcaceae bacterium OttesenSCG-928-O06]